MKPIPARKHIASTISFRNMIFALFLHTVSGPLFAACLGLGLPAPQTSNVCETLLEDLVIPRTEVFCDVPAYAPPHCHLPGACHVEPVCRTFEAVREIVSRIIHAGDLYCEPREIDPEEMIDKLAANFYTDTVKLTTGGLTSTLYKVSAAHIDTLECIAEEPNSALKNVLLNIALASPRSTNDFYGRLDVNRIRIISNRTATANLYLRDGFNAITLDSVVIFRPEILHTLNSWDMSWNEMVFGALSENDLDNLLVMIHELIHVRQYRQVGREQFINLYLANAITAEYERLTTEREARRLELHAKNIIDETIAAHLIAILQ